MKAAFPLVLVCLFFVGCEPEDDVLGELTERTLTVKRSVSSLEGRMEEHDRLLRRAEDSIRKIELAMSFGMGASAGSTNTQQATAIVNDFLLRLREIENNYELLKVRVDSFEDRIVKLEENANGSQDSKSLFRNTVVRGEASDRLLQAYDNLSLRVDKIDEGLNGVFGDKHVSNGSWLYTLKWTVDDMRVSVEELKREMRRVKFHIDSSY